MAVKDAIADCLQKRISAILIRRDELDPPVSVFFIFDDGTYYELYGRISSASEVRQGGVDEVIDYAAVLGGEVNWFEPNPDWKEGT